MEIAIYAALQLLSMLALESVLLPAAPGWLIVTSVQLYDIKHACGTSPFCSLLGCLHLLQKPQITSAF